VPEFIVDTSATKPEGTHLHHSVLSCSSAKSLLMGVGECSVDGIMQHNSMGAPGEIAGSSG
jgi:hypothetical protein